MTNCVDVSGGLIINVDGGGLSIADLEPTFVNQNGDTMRGNLNMTEHKILNLPTPTDDTEATNKSFVETKTKELTVMVAGIYQKLKQKQKSLEKTFSEFKGELERSLESKILNHINNDKLKNDKNKDLKHLKLVGFHGEGIKYRYCHSLNFTQYAHYYDDSKSLSMLVLSEYYSFANSDVWYKNQFVKIPTIIGNYNDVGSFKPDIFDKYKNAQLVFFYIDLPSPPAKAKSPIKETSAYTFISPNTAELLNV